MMENLVVFEDEYILVINKSNNVLVHHSKYTGLQNQEKCLVEILEEKFAQRFYPVHRLDRKTSGLIIFCKDSKQVKYFQALIEEQKITKKYLALVRGFVTEAVEIDSPIKSDDNQVYKKALSIFTPLDAIELPIAVQPYSTARYSLIEMEPKTGRMHQLRKHANKIAHPIIGDPKYGNRHHNHAFIEHFNTDFLYLHAYFLEFIHPLSHELVKILAPLPDFWSQTFQLMSWTPELPINLSEKSQN